MAIEALLTATVIKEATRHPNAIHGERFEFSAAFTDFLGTRCYAVCSSNHPETIEAMLAIRVGDVVAVRGHVAVIRSEENSSLRKKGVGSLRIGITGLMTLDQPINDEVTK